MISKKDPEVHVVGGGFSGLAIAWYLSSFGRRVSLYESSSRLGGMLGSLKTPMGVVERAANGLLASQDVEDLFSDLRLKLIPTRRPYPNRYIYRGRLRKFPIFLGELPDLFKLLWLRWRDFGIESIPAGENLESWATRNLSPEFVFNIIEPALRGVFGAPLNRLSARLILEALSKPLVSGKLRGTVAPLHGMEELINQWTVGLLQKGVSIHLNTEIENLDTLHGHVVLTTPPKISAHLMSGEAPLFLKKLESLPRVGLRSVTTYFQKGALDARGFGALFPSEEGFRSLGVLFNSDIFPERNEKLRSETYMFAIEGSSDDRSLESMVDRILEDRAKLYGVRSDRPLAVYESQWNEALPLYGTDLEDFLRDHELSRGRVTLFGNSYGTLGLSRILSKAKLLAKGFC